MCKYISWILSPAPPGENIQPYRSQYKAGVILLKDGNKFLLVKNYDGKWTFPKGSIEPGEYVQKAASRELEEETGIIVSPDSLKIFVKYYKQTYFVYRAHEDLDYIESKIKDKREITGIGWFCFDHISEHDISMPTRKILAILSRDIEHARDTTHSRFKLNQRQILSPRTLGSLYLLE